MDLFWRQFHFVKSDRKPGCRPPLPSYFVSTVHKATHHVLAVTYQQPEVSRLWKLWTITGDNMATATSLPRGDNKERPTDSQAQRLDWSLGNTANTKKTPSKHLIVPLRLSMSFGLHLTWHQITNARVTSPLKLMTFDYDSKLCQLP